MLMPRCSHGSVEANGLIYVCGGSLGNNVSGRVLSNCEVYDSVKEEWRELSGMREARKNHGLVFVNNRIYAVGGMNGLGMAHTHTHTHSVGYVWGIFICVSV